MALAEHGIDAGPEIVREISDHFDLRSAEGAATDLLTGPDRPTALLGHNDFVAVAIISAAHKLGLSVPGDLSVVGYDDIPPASYCYPPLTTIRQPMQEVGRLATRLLIQMIADPSIERRETLLKPRLIRRATCGS